MKASKIFVGKNNATLDLTSGAKGVAVYPAQKGDKYSFILLDTGKMVPLKGSRIAGVGVARYLTESGFELAQPGNPLAERLADLLDMREGTILVEEASQARARELQSSLAHQVCTYVPFDADKEPVQVTVDAPGYFSTTVYDMNGFACAGVQLKFDRHATGVGSSVTFHQGWLVGPEGDVAAVPRNNDYGGPIERAIFTMVNCGMGKLIGAQNLEMNDHEPYPRGSLTMQLPSGDLLVAGINAIDELEVQYQRDGATIYQRGGLEDMRFGAVVGSIAGVLVRVAELDAQAQAKVRKTRKAA